MDLDGTLLNSAKEITDTTAAILRAAREQADVQIVLASARPPRTVLPYYRLLDLDTPMINYNGALVHDPQTGRVLLHKPIPAKVVGGVIHLARSLCPEVLVSGELMDRWFTDRFDPAYLPEADPTAGPDLVAPLSQWADQALTKLLLLAPADRLAGIASEIDRRFPHQVTMVRSDGCLLQVMHATVSKAQALRAVAAELHVQRPAVMAIGDNANDVGMLQWAGVAVAMGNGSPEARAVADYVTDHHDADGAAHAIRRIILEGHAPGR